MMDNKSRMMGDYQVRFCERLKLKCFCLLDSATHKAWQGDSGQEKMLISSEKNTLSSFFTKCFSLKPLVATGKISYGMYMIHMAIRYGLLTTLHKVNIYNKYIVFVIYLPIVYGVAWIIYQLYEKGFLQLKEKFR